MLTAGFSPSSLANPVPRPSCLRKFMEKHHAADLPLPPPDAQAGRVIPGSTGPFCRWRACPRRWRARQREPGHRPLCCAGTSHQPLPGTGRCADHALDRRVQAGPAAICRQRGQDLYPGPVFTGCRGRARGIVRKPAVRGQRRVALAGQPGFAGAQRQNALPQRARSHDHPQ